MLGLGLADLLLLVKMSGAAMLVFAASMTANWRRRAGLIARTAGVLRSA
jgi:hypothetical protein